MTSQERRVRSTPQKRERRQIGSYPGCMAQKPPRLAYRVPKEAADALGVSPDFFDEHVRPELRLVHVGRGLLSRKSANPQLLRAHALWLMPLMLGINPKPCRPLDQCSNMSPDAWTRQLTLRRCRPAEQVRRESDGAAPRRRTATDASWGEMQMMRRLCRADASRREAQSFP